MIIIDIIVINIAIIIYLLFYCCCCVFIRFYDTDNLTWWFARSLSPVLLFQVNLTPHLPYSSLDINKMRIAVSDLPSVKIHRFILTLHSDFRTWPRQYHRTSVPYIYNTLEHLYHP